MKKQIKRRINKNVKSDIDINENDNVFKFITTIVGIILILVATYFIIGIFFTKEIDFKKEEETEEKTEATIDNDTITAGQIFNKSDESYYVLVYDVDSKLTNLATFVSVYKSSENSLPIYVVDSGNSINSKFIVKKNSNKNPSSYSDLKIKAPTLIKIENKKVTNYVEDEDKIKEILKNE